MSFSPLESDAEVRRQVLRLLKRIGGPGKSLPTPVDELMTAAGLLEAEDSLLDQGFLKAAPVHLRRAMSGLLGKIRGVLDRKERRVHVDPGIKLDSRRGFVKLHEVVHHLLPWQRELVYVDTNETLDPRARATFEREANAGAAHLMFQLDAFTNIAGESVVGFGAIRATAPMFGASLHAGLRRYVEAHALPMIGIVIDTSPQPGDPLRFRRHEVFLSPECKERFGDVRLPMELDEERFAFIPDVAGATTTRNTIVSGEWYVLHDKKPVAFRTEFFCTGYSVLALFWIPAAKPKRRQRVA